MSEYAATGPEQWREELLKSYYLLASSIMQKGMQRSTRDGPPELSEFFIPIGTIKVIDPTSILQEVSYLPDYDESGLVPGTMRIDFTNPATLQPMHYLLFENEGLFVCDVFFEDDSWVATTEDTEHIKDFAAKIQAWNPRIQE